ncbi:MAG: type II toxin-antitoxin system RelE/ParE family toxin [Caldilineaceae bacterium]
MAEKGKPIIWMGDSRKVVRLFPTEVNQDIGVALYDAQMGEKSPLAKPFKGIAPGVFEIAIRFDKNAYRLVYVVQIGQHIYVLHAFQKKSKRGIATTQHDVNLIKQRYSQAVDLEDKL